MSDRYDKVRSVFQRPTMDDVVDELVCEQIVCAGVLYDSVD